MDTINEDTAPARKKIRLQSPEWDCPDVVGNSFWSELELSPELACDDSSWAGILEDIGEGKDVSELHTKRESMVVETVRDVCLGAITVNTTSSYFKKIQILEAAVALRQCGSILTLHTLDADSYAGIATELIPSELLTRASVKLNALLTAPASLRVIISSPIEEAVELGDLLSKADFFLQHSFPREIEYFELEMAYFNPHYLVSPGSRMPQLEDLAIGYDEGPLNSNLVLDEEKKGRLMGIFDTVADLSIQPTTQPSPRLQTRLKEYSQYLSNFGTEMGLGKTLCMLSLICWSLDSSEHPRSELNGTGSLTTLVVIPKSTIPGWQSQIRRHICPGQIHVALYHGAGRQSLAREFQNNDIILTTYQTLRSEWTNKGPLFTEQWFRVVLDEAHRIGNRSTQVFQAACELQSHRRWCLTGTPIVNSIDNYGALLTFIRMEPLAEKSSFERWISKPIGKNAPEGLRRLRILVEATCLRRTKYSLSQGLPIPTIRLEKVELNPQDRALYDFFEKQATTNAAQFSNVHAHDPSMVPKAKRNVLSLINNLRRICDHGQDLLSTSGLETWRSRNSQEINLQMMHSSATQYAGKDCTIDPFGSLSAWTDRHKIINIPAQTVPSAKVQKLIHNLGTEQIENRTASVAPPIKSIVFSQWTDMLDLVQTALQQTGFVCARIDGQQSIQQRQKSMSSFTDDPHCTVMLATIGSGGEGIDLTVANNVHLMEPHWNSMAEEQAIGRVHRIGQQRQVTATKYITPGSIEEYVQSIQDEKIQIINDTWSAGSDVYGGRKIDGETLKKLERFFNRKTEL
ncbi:helicase-like transcription factor [Fusarium beomiforme]|uniref:Helicase-like transcription factor n=1 Tax=Fusarium beomiforme TaxID=44412 RepID=A0A9P5DS90_9HYPO|nr:helicase-like transcription factor [Fusarium beomiforme]